ncbi:MAG: hypothetical protein ACM3OO_01135 [Planctomycetaceae bacterium]
MIGRQDSGSGSTGRIVALALIGLAAALLVKRLAGGTHSWEERLAKMPDTSPPKWMFTTISAIRDNTDRILERMDTAAGA